MECYFAYGSNMWTSQMASRCPDSTAARSAVLADHDWLINQRGVATIRAACGHRVHGVLWTVSAADLAQLDRAEGVPHRYRRDRVSVSTVDGHESAWVYIDPRVQHAPPRPDYLPRVIAGAIEHRLPGEWVDFLRGWEPG